MSGGSKPHGPLPVYDAQDLRRRMPVCFTIGELCRLAEKLQVPETPAWSNNPQEASRDIVRHFERSGALAFLVEALREAKPLVEWPDPVLPEPALPVPPAPPPAPGPSATEHQAPIGSTLGPDDPTFDGGERPTPIVSAADAAVLASLGVRDARPSPEPAPAPGFAPARMPKPGEAPALAPSAPSPSSGPSASPPQRTVLAQPSELPVIQDPMMPASAPSPASRGSGPDGAASGPKPLRAARDIASSPAGSAAWPGTVRPSPPKDAKNMDPRVLLAAGFAMLLTAVAFAFFLGRASSASPNSSGSGATAAAEIPPDQAPIALHAAASMGLALERVARACKIEVGSLRGRSLFEVAYRRCGPPPAPAPALPVTQDDPTPDPDADPPADPARPAKKTGVAAGNRLQKVDSAPSPVPGAGGGGCLSGCSRAHSQCTSRCGAEPTQSSQYDAYQACLGGCLKAMSQCKLGCN